MYRELSKEEIKKFTNKYLSNWEEIPTKISCITYHFTKEYLVNSHYFIIVKPFKVEYREIYKLN